MAFDRVSFDRHDPQDTLVTRARSAAPPANPAPNGYGAMECATSVAIQRIRRLVEQSAVSDLPVLITGEVGVGKELIAREIHRRSSNRRLLEINCASIPEDFFARDSLRALAASATMDDDCVADQFATAQSATLFLKGVGELSAVLQEELLQLLRRSDGAQSTNGRPIDLRLIAATHRDLAHAVEEGRFSEELFYRLNLIHIHVPPLRSHLEDIPALLQHFLREHGKNGGESEEIPEIIRARMTAHEWPGNVRELENTIRCFVALGDPTYVLEKLDARADRDRGVRALHSNGSSYPPPSSTQDDGGYRVDLKKLGREASDAAEKDAIVSMLAHTMGNKKAAARRLGISYKALLYKIRDFGIAGAFSADDELRSAQSERPPTVLAVD